MRKKEFTRNYISDIFRELLTQKSYKKISIVDICKAANISRMTFYNNFQDKIELTVWMVKQDIFNKIPCSDNCFWDFYKEMVVYIEESRLFCLGMLNSSEHETLKMFYVKYMVSCLEKYTVGFFTKAPKDVSDQKAAIELMALLLIDAIENWILHYPNMPQEDFLQMSKLYLAIME